MPNGGDRSVGCISSLSSLALEFHSGFDDAGASPGSGLQSHGLATTAFNPLARPGELVVIIARGDGGGLGGKLANKLAVEHFTEAILELEGGDSVDGAVEASQDAQAYGSAVHKPRAVAMLEIGFERANGQVYAFGHKLAAGGALSTSIIAIAVSDGELAAAKVGVGDVLLEREGERVWLFSGQEDSQLQANPAPTFRLDEGERRRFDQKSFESTVLVGAHRQVPVDFLHLAIQPHDRITVSSGGGPSGPGEPRPTAWMVTVGPASVFLR
jgi:hypothetical protein